MKLRTNKLINLKEKIQNDSEFFTVFMDVTLISSEDINVYFFTKYGERFFSYYSDDSEDDGYETFKILWSTYKRNNIFNWTRMLKAYHLEYNPINNYDMTETEITKHEGNNVKETTTSSSTTTDTTTPNKTDVYVTSDENPSGRLSNYTSFSGGTSQNNDGTLTENETIADVNRTLSRSGNIGVTTSQQMLQSELELRRMDFVDYVLTGFLDKNTFFGGDLYGCYNVY